MKGLLIIVFFQLLGEFISALVNIAIPGPVVGMVLLLVFLAVSNAGHQSINQVANRLLPLLPLFIIPTSVGVITQWDLVKDNILLLSVSVIVSFIMLFVFAALLMKSMQSMRWLGFNKK